MRRAFALASELHRLSPSQRDSVTDIIPDDGEWSESQIAEHINAALAQELEAKDVEYYR